MIPFISYIYSMKGKIFLLVFIILLIGSSLWATNSVPFNFKGKFFLPSGWSGIAGISPIGWYPGAVDFDTGSSQIYPNGTLSGSFWMSNVWWVTFNHGHLGYEARINCPTTIWNDATLPCYVSWAAWSKNAGWIIFSYNDIGTGSGAYFDPNTGNLAGYWWSRDLWWVPFWSWLTGAIIPDASSIADPLDGVPINFVSRIAIVWNIAGSRVFSVQNNSVVNQDVGYSYKTINHAMILNMLRRNIALISRNIDDTTLASFASPHQFYIQKDGTDFYIPLGWNQLILNGKRSVIVIGSDIVFDSDRINSDQWINKNIAFIALKDEAWNWGNIIITDQVRQIYGYLYAEWSVFSWEKPTSLSPILPYTNSWIWNIPKGQLYIRGLVAAKNTIWWSQQKPNAICPVFVEPCTAPISYAYDWDYFRTYDAKDLSQGALPLERSTNSKLQNSTMIIEYDPDILVDPPPWFRDE